MKKQNLVMILGPESKMIVQQSMMVEAIVQNIRHCTHLRIKYLTETNCPLCGAVTVVDEDDPHRFTCPDCGLTYLLGKKFSNRCVTPLSKFEAGNILVSVQKKDPTWSVRMSLGEFLESEYLNLEELTEIYVENHNKYCPTCSAATTVSSTDVPYRWQIDCQNCKGSFIISSTIPF